MGKHYTFHSSVERISKDKQEGVLGKDSRPVTSENVLNWGDDRTADSLSRVFFACFNSIDHQIVSNLTFPLAPGTVTE